MVGPLATRIAGSSDLYQGGGRKPYHSINFITCHDGFTLNDLVSYNDKHNQANGEGNWDGENNNYSCSYGVEGPSWRRDVGRVRLRQIKNLLATLMLSQGVPMLPFGDECRRTQRGNNNAYCQDNDVSWFDWRLVRKHRALRRFVQALIAFRKAEPALRREDFLTGRPMQPGGLPDVSWYGPQGSEVDWKADSRSLQCLLAAVPPCNSEPSHSHHVLILCHAGVDPCRFVIPQPARHLPWRLFVNTAVKAPGDIYPNLDGPAPSPDGVVILDARSLVCYLAADLPAPQ
jgi:glycogen operon protein